RSRLPPAASSRPFEPVRFEVSAFQASSGVGIRRETRSAAALAHHTSRIAATSSTRGQIWLNRLLSRSALDLLREMIVDVGNDGGEQHGVEGPRALCPQPVI